jgi:hypothetical protein
MRERAYAGRFAGKLPAQALLVRTDFSDDRLWQVVCDDALKENEDGFRAFAQPFSDPMFDGATWESVRSALLSRGDHPPVLFIADRTTLRSVEHPILVVPMDGDGEKAPFRCLPPELWNVDNNLMLANLDWDDFASRVAEDGVFRGFDP